MRKLDISYELMDNFFNNLNSIRFEEKVEIYHDETYDDKTRPFGHQFIVIPLRSKAIVNQALMEIRQHYKGGNLTINWKDLHPRSNLNKNLIAMQWLSFLNSSMYNRPLPYLIGNRIVYIKSALGIKLCSVFIDSIKSFSDKYWQHVKGRGQRTQRKYETLLWMGILGGLHYCFNPEFTNYSKITLKNFYTDGEVFGKNDLDQQRIFSRLQQKIRKYITIDNDLKITKIYKTKNKTPEVNIQELTDLVLGSTRCLCGGNIENWRKKIIIYPLKSLYVKRKRGRGFFKSGHFRSFTISKCKINESENLEFTSWEVFKPVIKNTNQLYLF